MNLRELTLVYYRKMLRGSFEVYRAVEFGTHSDKVRKLIKAREFQPYVEHSIRKEVTIMNRKVQKGQITTKEVEKYILKVCPVVCQGFASVLWSVQQEKNKKRRIKMNPLITVLNSSTYSWGNTAYHDKLRETFINLSSTSTAELTAFRIDEKKNKGILSRIMVPNSNLKNDKVSLKEEEEEEEIEDFDVHSEKASFPRNNIKPASSIIEDNDYEPDAGEDDDDDDDDDEIHNKGDDDNEDDDDDKDERFDDEDDTFLEDFKDGQKFKVDEESKKSSN